MVCLLVVVMGGPASGENLNKEIKSCSKTEDTLKRLICYDNISKKIKDNKDIESYIETQYMLADEIYGFKPKNKLNALGKIKNIPLFDGPYKEWEYVAYDDGIFPISGSKLISKPFSQHIDTKKLSFFKPLLAYIKNPYKFTLSKKIIISNVWSFGERALTFFNLNYHEKQSSDFDPEDKYWSWGKSSFLFLNKEIVLDPKHKIVRMGERGGPSRGLWDIFKYEGQEYILILAEYYEWKEFEIYQINEYDLALKLSMGIGGL